MKTVKHSIITGFAVAALFCSCGSDKTNQTQKIDFMVDKFADVWNI
jgi:hypothetical protein